MWEHHTRVHDCVVDQLRRKASQNNLDILLPYRQYKKISDAYVDVNKDLLRPQSDER